jgi:hypothetical protein
VEEYEFGDCCWVCEEDVEGVFGGCGLGYDGKWE